jgi:hypothetical protein
VDCSAWGKTLRIRATIQLLAPSAGQVLAAEPPPRPKDDEGTFTASIENDLFAEADRTTPAASASPT